MEAQSCPDNMKSLNASRSGIHHQHATAPGITHDLKYMGMSAHKKIRTIAFNKFSRTHVIPARIAAHMCHKYLDSLTLEETMKRMFETESMIIAVACNAHKRLELCNFLSKFHPTPEIPGMPYLVHRLQKFAELPVKYTMCV